MARNKETLVLILDIGPTMHQHLEYMSKAVSAIVLRKLVHNKHDEVGLVYFGANETDNDLEGYANIVVSRPISVIAVDLAESVDKLPQGSRVSDFMDAVVVGIDMIVKKLGVNSKGNKRICLITDAETALRDPDESDGTQEDQVIRIAEQMQQQCISMDAVVIRLQGPLNSLKSKASRENEFLLRIFASRTKGELILAESYSSLLGAIRTRLVSPTTIYRGDLELTPNMSVKVWVYKKVSAERLPSMKLFSDKVQNPDAFASHEVTLDTEYKSTVDLDVTIPPEQRIKAYKYGPQFVPISSKEEDALKFKTEKGLKLIGFTDASNVPRHYYMKEANIFIPEPGNSKSVSAVSCLVRALKAAQKVAVVRCVWRAGQTNVVLGVLTPNPASEDDVADSFYFNIIPFSEDLREFPFASFNDLPAKQQPSKLQQDAADALVQMMDLAPHSSEETLQPERTPNPVLQRFYRCLHVKYLDPDANVPPLDGALQRIVEPDQALLHESELVLRSFGQQFTLTYNTQKEKGHRFWQDRLEDGDAKVELLEKGEDLMELEDAKPLSLDFLTNKKIDDVGSLNPVKDFEAMLARRDSGEWIPKAVKGMTKIIMDLLNSAYNGNTYEKAMTCLVALRAGCVMYEEPSEFNTFLQEIGTKCRGKRLNDFWQLIVSKNLTLINKDEAPDSEISRDEAAAFLSGETLTAQKCEGATEDEIDEMEALFDDVI